ncbi:MAG: hypothetical protein QOI10_269 [Solirubrobacterales bacterium]|jgi:hypothetical protein|nr:hypothetical protein [Solirubrobacterales bacterium]
MAVKRRTMRELHDERSNEKRAAIQVAIADGTLTVRQMTPKERKASDACRAAGDEVRAERAAKRRR